MIVKNLLACLTSCPSCRRGLIFLFAALLTFSKAAAQSPPNPNFHREQIFGSYQEFKDRLNGIAAVPDAAQRQSELNTFWTQLRNAGQVPYAQGDKTAFLYRGAVTSVSLAGDFNGWNPSSSSWTATQLVGTDLWMLEKSFPADARLDYKFVTGGNNWILDPANSLLAWSGFGPNSELRMPNYEYPTETIRQPGIGRGALGPNVNIASTNLGYSVNYRVYTPAGYSAEHSRNLPVVYVTDGHEYAADHLGSMVVVLDNLIGAGSLQPTIAVFIDPRDPASGFNRRVYEYPQNPKFLGFVADELVPAVDKGFRTLASPDGRMILGTSLGGVNAAYFGAARSDVFGNIAVQSPATFSQFGSQILNLYATQPLQDKLQLFVTQGTIGDGNAGVNLAGTLAAHDYDYKFVRTNEGHAWGNWRALLDDMLLELIGPIPSLEADFNEDGVINAADLALWKTGFGKAAAASRLDGDADGDRDVDGADFRLWQSQQGRQARANAGAVPEPGSASLIAYGVMLLNARAGRGHTPR
jgi:enterochelin esterase family protein